MLPFVHPESKLLAQMRLLIREKDPSAATVLSRVLVKRGELALLSEPAKTTLTDCRGTERQTSLLPVARFPSRAQQTYSLQKIGPESKTQG